MKRKVVLHGPSTLTVSLPSSWIKRFSIKKGDELYVEEQGREIRISTDSTRFETTKIDIKDLKRVGKSYITSSYRLGFDEIELSYQEPSYLDTIQKLINNEITGFEIIRHHENSCIVKDLTGNNKDEFNTALRRVWLLLQDLSNESLLFIKKKNPKNIKKIRLIDSSINKFTNYCLRVLIKKGHENYKKTPSYYHFVRCLEELADKYKELCEIYLQDPDKTRDRSMGWFPQINSCLSSAYLLFYKNDPQKIEELFNKTKLIHTKLSSSDDKIDLYLSFIARDIRNLLPLFIEMNI